MAKLDEPLQRRSSTGTDLLNELGALNHSLRPTGSRAASVTLSEDRRVLADPGRRAWSQRFTISRPRTKPQSLVEEDEDDRDRPPGIVVPRNKNGIMSWRPIRALSHIRMHRLGCLLSAEVAAIRGLPRTMNGLRLLVSIRKKENKNDSAVRTMPARVLDGSAEFDETLFLRCHVYCSGGGSTGKKIKFEPRLFVIYVAALDAPELDFGRTTFDLSQMVRESVERSFVGGRVRQWDVEFELSGKAAGGKLVLKLGFQIMEDNGILIYSGNNDYSASIARKQTKSSFSMLGSSFRKTPPSIALTSSSKADHEKGREHFVIDEPGPPSISPKSDADGKEEDIEFPEFQVEEKGVEVQPNRGGERGAPNGSSESSKMQPEKGRQGDDGPNVQGSSVGPHESVKETLHDHKERGEEEDGDDLEVHQEDVSVEGSSVSSDSVKEVLRDRLRLMEPELIAREIKALKSSMLSNVIRSLKTAKERESHGLHEDEEKVTREFLQMLDSGNENYNPQVINWLKFGAEHGKGDAGKVYVSDLGKNLGCVVQTKDGGYLASINPFNEPVERKDIPKLTMQVSRPFVLRDQMPAASGFEVLQRLAALGADELASQLLSLAAMDELEGKTPEQMAFEGIASAVINGRSDEGASSCASRSIATVKEMAAAMSEGRRERVTTGIWNVKEHPVSMEEILAFCLQKMEAMAVEALRIQAGVTEEDAPFEVSPLVKKEDKISMLKTAVPVDESLETFKTNSTVTLLVVIQLRDPHREYEAVGGPLLAVMQATGAENIEDGGEDEKFRVTSLYVGGMKLNSRRKVWDGEKQRLTAMQWLFTHGQVKVLKQTRPVKVKGGHDLLWSLSSRVMADMWLKPIRNPDVKICSQ